MLSKDFLFELSWEVCNKVGGIYTVITSKIESTSRHFKNYYLVGPYFKSSEYEYIEDEVPEKFQSAYDWLENIGIRLHFGIWLVNGSPNVILVEYLGYSFKINEIKGRLWEMYKIDSLGSLWYDYDEAILWSWCAGIAIEKLTESINEKVIVHSHEWMSGGAVFYLKSLDALKFRTVFTTHATMLGRALCGSGVDLQEEIENIVADEKAYEFNVHTKHQTEKALANVCDCFTTVSDITAKEAEKFYMKKPDILLYNGFDNSSIGDIDKLNAEFLDSRKKLNEFLKGYFHSFYKIDTDKINVFFTSGRNEFKNKGLDLFINSLGKLNRKLKSSYSQKNVVSLFLIPIGNFVKDPLVFGSIDGYKSGKQIDIQQEFAPICTSEISTNNEIVQAFLKAELLNRKDDNVKVILIPLYLNGADGFFDRHYYDVVKGADIGIFPSYYEPWGYTPLESISYAVPTLTSDLAGFGRFVNENYSENISIEVLKRDKVSFEDSALELEKFMEEFLEKSQKELLIQRSDAKKLALEFDWKVFIENYLKAYEMAIR